MVTKEEKAWILFAVVSMALGLLGQCENKANGGIVEEWFRAGYRFPYEYYQSPWVSSNYPFNMPYGFTYGQRVVKWNKYERRMRRHHHRVQKRFGVQKRQQPRKGRNYFRHRRHN